MIAARELIRKMNITMMRWNSSHINRLQVIENYEECIQQQAESIQVAQLLLQI